MTTTTDHEDRAVWVPALIAWAEQERDHYEAHAFRLRWGGQLTNAADYMALAASAQLIADRARVLLVPASQPVGLADACAALPDWTPPVFAPASDEPPAQLVPFVGWIRLKFGALLPGLSVETWQAIGCLILMARGLRP